MTKTAQRRFMFCLTILFTTGIPTLNFFFPVTGYIIFMSAMGFTIGTNLTIWIMSQQIEDMAYEMDVKVSGFLDKTAWMLGGKKNGEI